MLRQWGRLLTVVLIATGSLSALPTAQAAGSGQDFVTLLSLRHYVPASPADTGAGSLWRSGDADLSVTGSPEDGVTVSVNDGSVDPTVLSFAAPAGQSLREGVYDDASAISDRSASHPGVSVNRDANCAREYGRFTVIDMSPDLNRLELTYEIHCTNEYEAIFGEVHIGEPVDAPGLMLAPDHVDWPATYPGVAAQPVPITMINTGNDPVTIQAAQVTGDSAFSLTDDACTTVAAGSSCTLYVGFKPTEVSEQAGRLTVTDSGGTGTHEVALAGRGIAGHTSWRMNSDPGDWVGDGQSYDFTPATSKITAYGNRSHVELDLEGPNDATWEARFAPDPAHPLLPGTTYRAIRYPFNGDQPGMDVQGEGRGGESTGTFTVRQATYDTDGHVTSFSVTFEQHDGTAAPALFGSIAWRAADPPAPIPTGKTSASVSGVRGLPLTRAALLTWNNPASSYWWYTVVRRSRGTRAPSTSQGGLPEYSGRGSVLLSRGLLSETSYSWTIFPVYGSGAQAPPVHITLRGTRMTSHLTHTRPRRHQSFSYWGRLIDVTSGRGVAHQPVDVYHRVGAHPWKRLGGRTTDAAGRFHVREQYAVHRASYKAVYDGGGHHLGSSSDPVTASPRR
jgi:hypothetical protein